MMSFWMYWFTKWSKLNAYGLLGHAMGVAASASLQDSTTWHYQILTAVFIHGSIFFAAFVIYKYHRRRHNNSKPVDAMLKQLLHILDLDQVWVRMPDRDTVVVSNVHSLAPERAQALGHLLSAAANQERKAVRGWPIEVWVFPNDGKATYWVIHPAEMVAPFDFKAATKEQLDAALDQIHQDALDGKVSAAASA